MKKNLLIVCCLFLMVGCSVRKNNNQSKNENTNTMICTAEYDYGETVKFELIYDHVGENLQKIIINHTEEKSEEDDIKSECERVNSLEGVTCAFDETVNFATYTVNVMFDELRSDGQKEFGNYAEPTMNEMRKKLSEDGMSCSINNSNNESENNDTSNSNENYLGKYYGKPNEPWTTWIEIKQDGRYTVAVNECEGFWTAEGTFTIDGNTLTLSAIKNHGETRVRTTTFTIDKKRLIFISGGIWTDDNSGYDCNRDLIFSR